MTQVERPSLPLPSPAPLEPPGDFNAWLAEIGVALDAETITRLGDYLARLLAMNELVNLTSITNPAEAWTRHIIDALTLVSFVADLGAGTSVVDVGSGGGLPGIPLAIARPDLRVTLVESTLKKAAFLTAVSAALGLTNVSVLSERAEALARGSTRESFDVVTARAVGRLVSLLPITLPLLKPGGRALFIKGQRAEEELAEAVFVIERLECVHEKTTTTPTGRIVVFRSTAGARRAKASRR